MKLGFLCDEHRAGLFQQPGLAINCWQNRFDTGQILCQRKMWLEALPHLGYAIETAEIILTANAVKPEAACELFASSASLLVVALAKLEHADQCQKVYWLAVKRLTQELSRHPEAQVRIAQLLEELYRHIKSNKPKSSRDASVTVAIKPKHVAVH